jgi:hypothetical protein
VIEMAKTISPIKFSAKLSRPGGADKGAPWTFLNLPDEVSQQLPTRSQFSVEGTFNGVPFVATLDPDGEGGHWLKVKPSLQEEARAKVGDMVELEIAPATKEPEPEVPDDVLLALKAAPAKAMETWLDITPVARRDWIKWITSGKKAETRVKRIEVALSKMTAGNRRPCCFDRSGMYDKSLSCPISDDEEA